MNGGARVCPTPSANDMLMFWMFVGHLLIFIL
jgi:hypothetical protein